MMNIYSIGNTKSINYSVMDGENNRNAVSQIFEENIEAVKTTINSESNISKNNTGEGKVTIEDSYVSDVFAIMTRGVSYSSTTDANRVIQRKLNQLGFYNGLINGDLSSATAKKAIKNFQRVYGLSQTGVVNNTTKNKLDDACYYYRSVASKPDLARITDLVKEHNGFNEAKIRDYFSKIWAFLKSGLELTNQQACGVLGNMMAESGCCPNNAEDSRGYISMDDTNYKYKIDDGIGYGLIQWTYYTRKEGLANTASEMGLKVSDINAQLAFIRKESSTTLKSAWDNLKKSNTVYDATKIFYDKIEIISDSSFNKRYSNAQKIYSIMN